MIKRGFILIAILLICSAAWGNYAIVNNSGSTPADSVSIPFYALDSAGNMVAMGAGDSVFINVYYPSGALAYRDSLAYNGTKVTAQTVSDYTEYTWKEAIATIDGTPVQGAYSYLLVVNDQTSAALATPHKGSFQLLTETDFNLTMEYIKDALDEVVNIDAWNPITDNESLIVDQSTLEDMTVATVTDVTNGVTLANDAITAAKIQADAIGASEIADGAIDAGAIGADAIGVSEIAAAVFEEIWRNIDTTNIDSSELGEWLSTGISASLSDANMGAIADSVHDKDTADAFATAGGFGKFVKDSTQGSGAVPDSTLGDVSDMANRKVAVTPTDTAEGGGSIGSTGQDTTAIKAMMEPLLDGYVVQFGDTTFAWMLNADTFLTIANPTNVNGGESSWCIHSSIVEDAAGHGADGGIDSIDANTPTWRYALAFGMGVGNEYPNIAVSDDGKNWITPYYVDSAGDSVFASLPLKYFPVSEFSDHEIFQYNDTTYIYFRAKWGSPNDSTAIFAIWSVNEVNWSDTTCIRKQTVGGQARLMSPAVCSVGVDSIAMWYVDDDGDSTYTRLNSVYRIWATHPLEDFDTATAQTCTWSTSDSVWQAWHFDIDKYNGKYYALTTECSLFTGATGDFHDAFAVSDDGLTFHTKGEQILSEGESDSWSPNYQYRMTGIVRDYRPNPYYQVWYSARTAGAGWHLAQSNLYFTKRPTVDLARDTIGYVKAGFNGRGSRTITHYLVDTTGTDTALGGIVVHVKHQSGDPYLNKKSTSGGYITFTATDNDTLIYYINPDPGHVFPSSGSDSTFVTTGVNITDSSFGYDVSIGTPSGADLSRCYVYVYDYEGNAVEGATFTATMKGGKGVRDTCNSTIIEDFEATAETNSSGYAYVDIIKGKCLVPQKKTRFDVEYDDKIYTKSVLVPDSATYRVGF